MATCRQQSPPRRRYRETSSCALSKNPSGFILQLCFSSTAFALRSLLLACCATLLLRSPPADGQKMDAYPVPDFSTSFKLSSQAGISSFKEVSHNLGVVPFRVRVYATPTLGNNKGYAFEGVGSAQTDDTMDYYGGLVFAFNSQKVRVWAPSSSSGNAKGRVLYIKDGWGGEVNTQGASTANVTVDVWKTGPTPSWQATVTTLMSQQQTASYTEVLHNMHMLPQHVTILVEATDGNNRGFFFYGVGSAQSDDDGGAYGGVVYAYDENNIRLWVPCKNPSKAGNTKGRMIFVDDGWAAGRYSQQSNKANVHIKLWLDDWPAPTFQSQWVQLNSQSGTASFKAFTHGLGEQPARVVVQVRAVDGNNNNFVFEGVGSAMTTDTKNHQYGGVVFAYNKQVVRVWAPDRNNHYASGRIIFVKDGWGGEKMFQASTTAMVRVLVWRSCPAGQLAVVGGCIFNTLTSFSWSYTPWGSCSVACNNGKQMRTARACSVRAQRTVAACNFDSGYCGYTYPTGISVNNPRWLRKDKTTPSSNTGPTYDHTKTSGYYVYTETSGVIKGSVGILTSPTFNGDSSCVLYFYFNMYGSDIGILSVDVMQTGSVWKTGVWSMRFSQNNIWRLATVPLKPYFSSLQKSQIRFTHKVGSASSTLYSTFRGDAAIDDIKIVCDAFPTASTSASKSVCQAKQNLVTGCVVDADSPQWKGAAFKTYKSTTVPSFTYIKPSGKNYQYVARWVFNIATAGTYVLWMNVNTPNSAKQQNIRIKLDQATPVNWFFWKNLKWVWWPFQNRPFTMTAGAHELVLQQYNTNGLSVRQLMLVPTRRSAATYGPLGMQSRLIPDSAISATSSLPACLPIYGRLHSQGWQRSAWCSSQTQNNQRLSIRLMRPAIIFQVGTQGRQDAAEWVKSFKLYFSLAGSPVQVYREGSSFKKFYGNTDQNTVKLNVLAFPVVADRILINPITWQTRPSMRVELYGLYIDTGLCTVGGPPKNSRECKGNGNCTQHGSCPALGSDCTCQTGWYGERCTDHYCSGSPCRNGATCVGETSGFRCVCPAGLHGLVCDQPCSAGTYGPGCVSRCKCNSRGTCNAKDGTCDCNDGWIGKSCETACPTGKYGKGCQLSCKCQFGAACSPIDGSCTCKPGFKGIYCDSPCAGNEWGVQCAQTCLCQNGATCDPTNGTCYCAPGYIGIHCQQPCPSGLYGWGCRSRCQCQNSGVCNKTNGKCTCITPGYTGPLCNTNCSAGRYGVNCAQFCTCKYGACDRGNGACHCSGGYMGVSCDQACPPTRYGVNCVSTCSCVNGAQCNTVNGSCTCRQPQCICDAGWFGERCDSPCLTGQWGKNCANTCRCKNGGVCNRTSGSCSCQAGFKGTYCDKPCKAGSFGIQCTFNCSCDHQNTARCSTKDGACTCKAGWEGTRCDQPCSFGHYGKNCTAVCQCKNGAACHPVDGSCKCTDGYYDPTCSSVCYSGSYGPDCTRQCRCARGTCSPFNGSCTCPSGWKGIYCDSLCPSGFWGAKCQLKCSCANGASCRSIDGACQCTAGWLGSDCRTPCPVGTYGLNCTNACPSCYHGNGTCAADTGFCACPPGYTGFRCLQVCPANTWGIGCAYVCACSHRSYCNPTNGHCQCRPGYMGAHCNMSCPPNHYGPSCLSQCNCINGKCNKTDGTCSCSAGYTGLSCSKACTQGYYGHGCQSVCSCSNGASCNNVDGRCSCPAGWTGRVCNTPCPFGYFGQNCSQPCQCRNGGLCNRFTGACQCMVGWVGQDCDQTCPFGFYGVNCRTPCQCQNNASCHHITGSCTCAAGYEGTNCDKACLPGRFGLGCQQLCNCHLPNTLSGNTSCDPVNGHCQCTSGYYKECRTLCPEGFYGRNCISRCSCLNGALCNKFTGKCTCTGGFNGTSCEQKCPAGRFGSGCVNTCNCMSPSSIWPCNPKDGACRCRPGYRGGRCENMCPHGYYGDACSQKCNCSSHMSSCHPVVGTCYCAVGWIGGRCENACPQGKWGSGCLLFCDCHNGFGCNTTTGSCQCGPGYSGEKCEKSCPAWRYGRGCTTTCSCSSATSTGCSAVNGTCSCKSGRLGNFCNQTCPKGLYGDGCQQPCPVCAPYIQDACQPVDGQCNCSSGFVGYNCEQDCPLDHFGANCSKSCQCVDGGICNNVLGTCQDVSSAKVGLIIKTPFDDFTKEGQTTFELAMARLLDKFLFKNPQASFDKGHLSVKIVDGSLIPSNDGLYTAATPRIYNTTEASDPTSKTSQAPLPSEPATRLTESPSSPSLPPLSISALSLVGLQRVYSFNKTVYVRILSVTSQEADGQPASNLEFVVYYKNKPVPAEEVQQVLGDISPSILDTNLQHQLYRSEGGDIIRPTPQESKSKSSGRSVGVFVGSAVAGVVLLIATVFAVYFIRRRLTKDPRHGDPRYGVSHTPNLTMFTSEGRKSGASVNSYQTRERTSGILVRNSSHMAFDNPYYDVMVAMAADDDMDDEFSNPLYNQRTSGAL